MLWLQEARPLLLGNTFILIPLECSGSIANIACNWGDNRDFVQGVNCILQVFDAPTMFSGCYILF